VTGTPTPTYLVYKVTSPSGKVYVGLTRQTLRLRKHQHENAAPKTNGYFQKALCKYRQEMVWETLEAGIQGFEKAADRERHFIALFQSNDPEKGYNATPGGDTGRPPEKPGAKEKHPVLRSDGVLFPSARAASRALSAANDDAVGRALRRGGTYAGFGFRRVVGTTVIEPFPVKKQGHAQTPETRGKISGTRKGSQFRASDQEQRRLNRICKKVVRSDGQVFQSIKEAASTLGLKPDNVAQAIRKGTARLGFSFKLLGD
jgi:predicted GIY-YIG superfamily endonuclease